MFVLHSPIHFLILVKSKSYKIIKSNQTLFLKCCKKNAKKMKKGKKEFSLRLSILQVLNDR